MLVASFVVPGGIDAPTVGLFGTSLAILAILSTMGVMISINTFALVSNNVNVVSGSFESEYEVLPDDKMSLLGQIGHNTIALGKNFINLCSILSAITIMIACTFVSGVDQLDILNPYDMSSLLLGCATPFLYCGMIMGGIPKIASRLVFQVKKQFRNFPQILRQEMRPDYEKCVDIAAFNSCVQVVVYTLIVLAIFALITIYFKVEAMNAFIIGVIVSSCGLIFTSSNSYLIARSAKKYFENEFINAQYSEEYGAITAVDAVYSMAKDLITPCLNVLVKFVSIIALILAIYMSNLQG